MKAKIPVCIAYECSGAVRRAFAADSRLEVWSVDMKPAEDGETRRHRTGDALAFIRSRVWGLVIAHPPCTRLCNSGVHLLSRPGYRAQMIRAAMDFGLIFQETDAPLCVENPTMHGHARRLIGSPPGVSLHAVQPYEFGHDASKRTVLWLRGLPPLVPTRRIKPRMVDGLPRRANQTDSGQNRLGPSPTRAADRARTYPGIARAMAAPALSIKRPFQFLLKPPPH